MNREISGDEKIAVVGLGYVGLPLALAFGKTPLSTTGYDVNPERVKQLRNGEDGSADIPSEEIKNTKVKFTSDQSDLRDVSYIVAAVPTPVTSANEPEMTFLKNASQVIGKNMSPGTTVIYESTVYPGATEEICVPLLEQYSGLKWKNDFNVGYSPERINPGDREHTIDKIVKVVAGDTEESSQKIAALYQKICQAGVHLAPNIKTAEAAKVIENTQRDLNIALANELSLIFHRLGIDTSEVLEAAATKWNFHKYTPGLVGGHCIGVDPYYLVYKAKQLNYHPEVITAGRKINDAMASFAAELIIKGLSKAKKSVSGAKILVMGLTFKENVKDYRNSKIADTIGALREMGAEVFGHDPLLSEDTIRKSFRVEPDQNITGKYDAVVIGAPHEIFVNSLKELPPALSKPAVIVDIKKSYPELKNIEEVDYSCF